MSRNMLKRIIYLCLGAMVSIAVHAQELQEADSVANDSILLQEAQMYRYGINTDVNLVKAAGIYKQLARKYNVEAMTCLGEMYMKGEGVATNCRYAYNLYKRAADSGYPEAMCRLARMYQTGIGVKQNYEKAFYYYNEASKADYPEGHYGAGYLIYKGLGVRQDYEQAERFLQRGSALKHEGCDFLLGAYYASDYGKEPDYEKAKQHYNKAVKGGHGWTIDMTKYNGLDSIKSRNSTRSKLAAGKKWKDKLKWTPDAELAYVTIDSLCGTWSGKAYVYDWSGSTVTSEEPVKLQFEREGDYFTMEWLRNDTVFLKFQPESKDNDVWKSSHVNKEYMKTYPWAISRLQVGMTKDNQLCAHIRRMSIRHREPMRPVIAILTKQLQGESSGPSFRIIDMSPKPFRGSSFQITLSADVAMEVSVSLYSMTGVLVANCGSHHLQQGSNVISLNAALRKGKYVLQVSGNGQTESKSVIHL